jgi:integrase
MRLSDNNGSIRIQFIYQGRRYSFSPGGRFLDPIALAFAGAIAARIELDIQAGCFDESLRRYRSDGIIPIKKSRKFRKLLAVWDRWVETLGLSAETKADHYEMVRRMIVSAKPAPTIDDGAWFVQSGTPWYVKRVADWLPLGAQKPIASMGRCPFVKC